MFITSALGAYILLGAWWITRAGQSPRFDSTGHGYGVNWPGDLEHALSSLAIEVGALILLIRPWSFRHSIGRLFLATVLWFIYAPLALLATMHGGPIIHAHVLWMLALGAGLLAGTAWIAFESGRQPSERAA